MRIHGILCQFMTMTISAIHAHPLPSMPIQTRPHPSCCRSDAPSHSARLSPPRLSSRGRTARHPCVSARASVTTALRRSTPPPLRSPAGACGALKRAHVVGASHIILRWCRRLGEPCPRRSATRGAHGGRRRSTSPRWTAFRSWTGEDQISATHGGRCVCWTAGIIGR